MTNQQPTAAFGDAVIADAALAEDVACDEQLAARTGAGDANAWQILYERHAPTLRRWLARQAFRDEDDSLIDSIIDDVFGDRRHFAGFGQRPARRSRKSATLRTYLIAIARNQLAQHRMRVCRAKRALGTVRSLDAVGATANATASGDFSGDSVVATGEMNRGLVALEARDAVECLRRTLDEIDCEICDGIASGDSLQEIGRRVNLAPGAVATRWHRLRHRLRGRFAHLFDPRSA